MQNQDEKRQTCVGCRGRITTTGMQCD